MPGNVNYGVNPSGYIKPLALDASGNLLVSGVSLFSGATALLLDSSGRAIVRGYGLNDLFGFSAAYQDYHNIASLSAGTNNYDFGTVPAGEIWIVTHVWSSYTGTITNVVMQFGVWDGANNYTMTTIKPVTTAVGIASLANAIAKAGQNFRYTVLGATATNSSAATVLGYKMKVP